MYGVTNLFRDYLVTVCDNTKNLSYGSPLCTVAIEELPQALLTSVKTERASLNTFAVLLLRQNLYRAALVNTVHNIYFCGMQLALRKPFNFG